MKIAGRLEIHFLPEVSPAVRHAFRWDCLAGFLAGVFTGGILPFLGVIARSELAASAFLIAVLSAAGSVGNLFNPFIAYYIRDRVKLPYAQTPFAVGRAFFLLMPLAYVAPLFIAFSFLATAITALGAPAYAAVIRDAYPVAKRGKLMGLVRVIVVAGSMLGALSAGLLLAQVSFKWVFPIFGLIGITSVYAFSKMGVRAEPGTTRAPRGKLIEAFRMPKADQAFQLYATAFYLYGLGNLILGPIIPIFQVDVLHITPQWVGYLATAASASSMLGYLFWGQVLDRHGPFKLMLFVATIFSVSPLVYVFAKDVPILLIAAVASGIAMAGGDLAYVNAAMRFARRDNVVSYAGTFAFLQAMRGIPGPFIGAWLYGIINPRFIFLLGFAFLLASVVVILWGGGLRLRILQEDDE